MGDMAEEIMDEVLDGVTKTDVQEEIHHENVEAHGVAIRLAVLAVDSYATRHRLPDQERNELLDMLDLPRQQFTPPPRQDPESLIDNLPKVVVMDTRAPSDHLIPERKSYL